MMHGSQWHSVNVPDLHCSLGQGSHTSQLISEATTAPFFTSLRFTAYNYLFMPFSTTVAFKDDTALFNNLQSFWI